MEKTKTVKVLLAGSSGLIGTALASSLERAGHVVVRLVRRAPRAVGGCVAAARAMGSGVG